MFKSILFCTLMVCVLSAPTENPSEGEATETLPQEKSLLKDSPVYTIAISSPSKEKREKRENTPLASSSGENKRTIGLSQVDYQENKPPTFVHPVPVDQIIKNSHASPQIHSIKHTEDGDEEANSEEGKKIVNDDDSTENHRPTYNKKTATSKSNNQSDENHSHENH